MGQGAEYWPPRAIRDLFCPLRWLSLVNLTLYLLCHTELFLLTMNYNKTVRLYSLLPSERRWLSCILNLIGTVIVRVGRLLGLLLAKYMNCSSFKATDHPDRNIPSSGKRKVHFSGKKSQALDIIPSQKYPVISWNAISLKNKIWHRVQILELLMMQFFKPRICTSIQIITLFSNTLNLCLFLKDKVQSSYSHKTYKIIFPRGATTR